MSNRAGQVTGYAIKSDGRVREKINRAGSGCENINRAGYRLLQFLTLQSSIYFILF
jgi:hypothetical protein